MMFFPKLFKSDKNDIIDIKSKIFHFQKIILFGMFLNCLQFSPSGFQCQVFHLLISTYFLGGNRLCIKMSLVKCYKSLNIYSIERKKVFLFLNIYHIGRVKEKAHPWICNISTSCNSFSSLLRSIKTCWVCSVVTVPAADTNSTIMI